METSGGVDDDGKMQRFAIDLLDKCPRMPKYEEMLRIVARDPVALARFFILAERLFCEHILGTGPWDGQLRHHGRKDGIIFPDGFAANDFNRGMNFIASMHGPIEEQARLSVHSHKCIQFVNRTSQA